MVRGEDDNGIVNLAAGLKRGQNVANCIIYHGDHACGQRARLPNLTIRCHKAVLHIHLPGPVLQLFKSARQMWWRIVMRLIGTFDFKLVRMIHIPIFARRGERMMGIGE